MRGRLAAFCLLALALSLPLAAQEPRVFEQPYNWEHPEALEVSDRELLFNDPYTRHFQSRSFYYTGLLDSGHIFTINVFRWVYSIFGGWGLAVFVVDPGGETFLFEERLRESALTVGEDSFLIRFGDNLFEGEGMEQRIRLNLKEFSCDLSIRNILPPWQPGDGLVTFTREADAYMRFGVPSPWATISGTMTVKGKLIPAEGTGYGDRSLFVMPMNRINSPVFAFRVFSPGGTAPGDRWLLSMLRYVTHKDYGAVELPMLLLAQGSHWVFTTKQFSFTALDFTSGGEAPLVYPKRFAVSAEHQGHLLQGEFVATRLYHYTDVFQKLPPLFREIASLFLKRPIFFRLMGYFRGSLVQPDGSVQRLYLLGQGEYEIVR